MKLTIDHLQIEAKTGQTLLELIRELGLDTDKLSSRPLVAKIAGETFTLNYVPVRLKEELDPANPQRRAMAASGGKVRLLRYCDNTGRDAYTRTVQFVLFLALRQLYPGVTAKMNCTVGQGLYIQVLSGDFDAAALKAHSYTRAARTFKNSRARVYHIGKRAALGQHCKHLTRAGGY